MAKPNVHTITKSVCDVSAQESARLYALLCQHFEHVTQATFEKDLREKDWIFLLTDDANGDIQGFSTLTAIRTQAAGQPVTAWFTGDTIIAPEHWGDRSFLRAVGAHWFNHAAELGDGPIYWLLMTCTYRSYRFLPGFFHRYYPRFDEPTPAAIQERLDALVRLKFGDEYKPDQGVVVLRDPLSVRPDRVEIPATHMADPAVQFFVRKNPDFARGNYLACLAEINPSNVNKVGMHLLGWPGSVGTLAKASIA
jgi:hypothetical protein